MGIGSCAKFLLNEGTQAAVQGMTALAALYCNCNECDPTHLTHRWRRNTILHDLWSFQQLFHRAAPRDTEYGVLQGPHPLSLAAMWGEMARQHQTRAEAEKLKI